MSVRLQVEIQPMIKGMLRGQTLQVKGTNVTGTDITSERNAQGIDITSESNVQGDRHYK